MKPLMRCFTDAQLREGLHAVIEGWNRCTVCGHRPGDRDAPIDHEAHPFVAPDVLDLFLQAAQSTVGLDLAHDVAPGERDHE